MAGRYGGRYGTNQEQEQRRLQREPVAIWKKEWILPTGTTTTNPNVKILKWVRTGDVANFEEEEAMLADETMMTMDVDSSAMLQPEALPDTRDEQPLAEETVTSITDDLQQPAVPEMSIEPATVPAMTTTEDSVPPTVPEPPESVAADAEGLDVAPPPQEKVETPDAAPIDNSFQPEPAIATDETVGPSGAVPLPAAAAAPSSSLSEESLSQPLLTQETLPDSQAPVSTAAGDIADAV